jgi:hypothetical protein
MALASMPRHGCGFYKFGKRLENSLYLARMLQSIPRVSPFSLIADNLGKPQSAQDVARARYAPTDRLCYLTGAQVFTVGEQGDDGKRRRVTEQTTEPGLAIGYLFHGSDAYHVFAIAKTLNLPEWLTASGGVGIAWDCVGRCAGVRITRHSEGVQAVALGSADSLSD